ncbi:MAG TPA: hypothetical protein VFP63_00545 [Dehalococcoidia bacterium]|nr:hypothetical protein [Dehalococcoidia bacterium]
MRSLVLALLVMTVAACSDRVPAPTTPTPTSRPGYPPPALAEVPEGVLFIHPAGLESLLFRVHAWEEAESVSVGWVVSTSSDGSRALTARSQIGEVISLLGIMTGSTYQEFSNVPGGVEGAIWSPDGKRLAYTQPDETAGDRSQVGVVDVDTGHTTQLTTEADFYSLLGWTARGEVLVSTSQGLVLVGKERRPIELREPGAVVDVEISPDGRSVAVKVGEYEYSEADELTYIHSSGIWVLTVSSGRWRKIVDQSGDPPGVQTTVGDLMGWSPDAKRLAYHSPIGPGWPYDRFGLDVVDVVTGERTHIVDRPVWTEAWSRDGRYLAFLYQDSKAENRLGLLGPDGRTSEVDILVRRMVWTNNGRLLVDIPGHLSLLDPETMEKEEVVTDDGKSISGLVEAAVWSPSGRYVALATPSDAYNRSSLYIIDTEKGTADLFFDGAGFAPVAWLRK